MISVLPVIADLLERLAIPYDFEVWQGAVSYPYWIGHYIGVEPTTEGGEEEYDFILTGTTNGTWLQLQQQAEKIKQLFDPIGGYTARLEDGSGVGIWYASATPIPTDTQELKRLEITLTVKKWRA